MKVKLPQITNLTVLLSQGEAGRVAPTEFKIWSYGTVETTKGAFLFTREDAETVVRRALEKGTDLFFDYEHQAFHAGHNGQPAIAAGWFKLEARGDGLYASGISWTDKARGHLEAGEYRYFSPAFNVTDDGHIDELYNIALTNLPATKNIEALVAASQTGRGTQEETPRMKILLTTLGLAADATEAEAVQRLSALQNDHRGILTLTGQTDTNAALGVITGWKQAADQVPTLTARVNELESAQKEAEVEALLDKGVKEGKITPAQRETFKAAGAAFLTSFLATAPVIVSDQPHKEGVDNKKPVVLTAEEKDMCKRLKISEDDYIAQKREQEAVN